MQKRLLMLMVCVLGAVTARASIPTNETFDTLLAGSDFVVPQRGWGADASSAVVTSAKAQGGANSVDVNGATISNNVNAGAVSGVVWTEFHLIPQPGDAPVGNVTNVSSLVQYFDTNACLRVFTAAGYVTVTQDVHGVSVGSVSTSTFSRLSIYQNFSAAKSAVLLNGVVVLQDVAFAGTSTHYDRFEVRNPEPSSAYLDTFSAGSTVPASADGNGNSTPDAQELQNVGYVARNFIVGSGPGAHFASLAAAAAVVRSGDTLTISGTVSDAGTATFNASVRILGDDFSTSAALVVATGYTLTLDGVAMDVNNTATLNGTLAIGSGASFTASSLTMASGGLVDCNGGTWGVDAPSVQMAGTFDVSGTAYNSANTASTLDLAETFELYGLNVALDNLRFRGWGASSAGAVVTNFSGQQGQRSAFVSGVISNRINGGGAGRVWTDLQLCAVKGAKPTAANIAGCSVLLCVTTNGFLSIYDTGTGDFVEAKLDAGGHAVTPIADGAWARVSIFSDYSQDKAAIFLNDHLLREQLSFPGGALAGCTLVAVENGEPLPAALDNLNVTQTVPNDLTGDVDGDSLLDAQEIDAYGTLLAHGHPASLFKFR